MFIPFLAAATVPLWVSADMFLSGDGRIWQRGKDGLPATRSIETHMKIAGAAGWRDGGFYALEALDQGGVVVKITPGQPGQPPIVKKGFPNPSLAGSLYYSVQPYSSADVVVQAVGSPEAALYSKSTYWSNVPAEPSRGAGFAQSGNLFYVARLDEQWSFSMDPLTRFNAASLTAHPSATTIKSGDGAKQYHIVPSDTVDAFVVADEQDIATEFPVGKGEAVVLGKLPTPSAAVFHAQDGKIRFAFLDSAGEFKTVVARSVKN